MVATGGGLVATGGVVWVPGAAGVTGAAGVFGADGVPGAGDTPTNVVSDPAAMEIGGVCEVDPSTVGLVGSAAEALVLLVPPQADSNELHSSMVSRADGPVENLRIHIPNNL